MQSLKLIKIHLQHILEQLKWEISQQPSPGGSTIFLISNAKKLRKLINELDSLELFDEIVKKLLNSAIFTSSIDTIKVQNSEYQIIVSQLELLKTLLVNFSEVLKNTVPEESKDSINIKLPPITDFDELSKVSRDIHIALTQVILNDEIEGETKIVSVENGSIWLNVFVGTTAVTVVASLVWSAAVIYKKIQEGKLLEQQIRGLKVKNDSLEDILKAQKAETALLIQAESEFISSEHFKTNQPENIEKIKHSISIFSELIEKGAEIHPALVAPENVSNLFPNPTNLISIESKIKKLANPNNN